MLHRQKNNMDRVMIVKVLLFAIFGIQQGVTAWKPTMNPDVEQLVIQEGEELRISCRGDGPIHFSTMNISRNIHDISVDGNSGEHTFHIHNALASDTGWYACAEEGVEIRNDEQTIDHPDAEISWIYVYVNSTNPFAVAHSLHSLWLQVGTTGVIPCRPTLPTIQVKLYKKFGDPEIPEEAEFDPKIGFILKNLSLALLDEMLECKIVGIENSDSEASYILTVTVPKILPKPIIDGAALRHVVWGKNQTLTCSIVMRKSDLFTLKWKAPSSVSEDRLIPDEKSVTGLNNVTHRAFLTIVNVQKSDEGEYICTLKDNANNVTTKTHLKIWDPNYVYLNVSLDDGSSASLQGREGGTARWKMTVDSYPENVTWTWFKGNSDDPIKDVTSLLQSKYSHIQDERGRTHVFRIARLSVRDTANYTIRASTRSNMTDTILHLNVEGQPIAHMTNTLSYFMPGQSVDFICKILSNPQANVTWIYREYPKFPSRTESKSITLSNTTSIEAKREPFTIFSRVTVKINETGDLVCKSCNRINCTEVTDLIYVSDVASPFEILEPKSVTEGDTISVLCGASVYNYSDKIEWDDVTNSEDGRISVEYKTTKFTHQAILIIRDVQMSDSGNYTCHAFDPENNNKEPQTYILSVKNARAPDIYETNLNNSQIVKEKKDSLHLSCSANGAPVPTVTWLKDGYPIKKSQQYEISSDNSTLYIQYFLDGDNGHYACRAENRIKAVERYVDIVIEGNRSDLIWISLICVLILIIIIVITYMGYRVHRERLTKKVLFEAGLTHFEEGALECLNPDLTIDDQAELLPYDKKWEFPRENLKLGKQLGSGAFGVVMKAEARGICEDGKDTTVAVKMVRRSAEPSYMKALSSELKIMIHLGKHLNVVNLLGACTKTILTKRELYVIVEYCRFGNLHNYLQRHRASFVDQIDPATQKIDPNIGMERLTRSESIGSQNRIKYAALSFSRSVSVKSSDSNSGSELVDYRQATEFGDVNMSPDGGVLSNNSVQPGWRSNYRGDYKDHNLKPIRTQDLLCWAWQVSRGMDYLSSRNVLHGDLAARNILLADDNVVKICDFGLAKNMYKDDNYKKKGDGPLPIKWMAIESIRDRIFSTQSDVWSFGIVLWEFFTLARTPYPGMEAEKQYDRLIEGYRMEKPEHATDEIYACIQQCWKAKPSLRPTFPELVEKLGTLLNESVKMIYFDLNTPYMDMNTANLANGQSDYLTMMSAPSHDYHNSPEPSWESRPDSAYLSMSPLNKSTDPGIFSPRPEVSETHFDFSPLGKTTPVNSDSEDCIESAPMLTPEEPYLNPINVQQRRAEFVKQQKEKSPSRTNLDYCNVATSPPNNQISDSMNTSDRNLNKSNMQNIYANRSPPPIITGHDNYVNMPQQKNERLKDMNDSFSNPSYVTMSNLELQDRQIV
ncbi:vascular endothelial growth factor receptor 1-like [Diprion similis]|uniref:vascular endothelial growth factor receptor 1-like n=1 Tax=Diprion similis TaxID=362088 RepID=UPI001EF8C9C9|nr:vascular endothelial growth factor receptor 1-like [Diprion similis]